MNGIYLQRVRPGDGAPGTRGHERPHTAGDLLVCDLCGCQEVLVHTNDACCFRPGECVCIEYSGAMTMSLPPQISAERIRRVPCGGCCC